MNSPINSEQSEHLVRSAIRKIATGPNRGKDISQSDSRQICEAMLAGTLDPVQSGIFLIALRMKGESSDEIAGLLAGLHSVAQQYQVDLAEVVCLADPFDGYQRYASVTAFMPAVLAACGLPTYLHGVHSVAPKHGVTPHQIYAIAGIDPMVSLQQSASQLQEVGWSYVDQATYAPQLHALQGLRQAIVKRTALTTLERVLMPLKALDQTHLALGYVHRAYPQIYASCALQSGFASALLYKGVEGGLAPALNKPLRTVYYNFFAEQDGAEFSRELPAQLTHSRAAAGLVEDSTEHAVYCLKLGLEAMNGEHGPVRSSLCAALAPILTTHSRANSFASAVEKVQNSLDNGSALSCFQQLINGA